MKKLIFSVSIVLISLSWRLGLHITTPPNLFWAISTGLGGVALLALVLNEVGPRFNDKGYPQVAILSLVVALMASMFAAIDLRGPMAILYLLCAVISLVLVAFHRSRNAVWHSRLYNLWIPVVIISICGISTVLLRRFGWWFHEIRVPDGFGALLGRLIPNLDVKDGLLTIWTRKGVQEIRLGFELLGFYELWLLGVTLVSACFLIDRGQRMRYIFLGLLILMGYGLARSLVCLLAVCEFGKASLLWDSKVQLLTWIPVAFLLPQVRFTKERGFATGEMRLALVALGSILLGFSLGFDDPGHLKPGRVLIDEAHSDWEWTDSPFDTAAIGMRAEYNYACLYDYLASYYTVSRCKTSITPEVLTDTDVLILKTPTQPYSNDEIAAIVDFVRRGGGLLLIGDHTNLFGMSTYLNEISSRFGMCFRYDDTFDLPTGNLSRFLATRISRHSTLRKVNRLDFLTSCSIRAYPLSVPVIVGYGLASEDADYGHPNFFGNISYDLTDRFGLFLQCASRKVGKGRIILFTDSTCFSNFCLFGSDMHALMLGFIDFLNRQGKRYPYLWILPIAGLASICIGARLSDRGSHLYSVLLAPILFSLFIGYCLGKSITFLAYGDYEPIPSTSMVLFDCEHTDARFTNYLNPRIDMKVPDYTGLFVSVLRVGFYPRCGRVEDLHACKPAGLVIIEPNKGFTRKEVEHILSYVSTGGRLLIIDSVRNGKSTVNQILEPLNLSVVLTSRVAGDTTGFSIHPYLSILGGMRVGYGGDLHPDVFCSDYGRGCVVVAVDGFQISGSNLPVLVRGVIPANIRNAYRSVCKLIEIAFGLNPSGAEKTQAYSSIQ